MNLYRPSVVPTPPVAEPLENPVDRIVVVVAPVGSFRDGPRLVEVVQRLECLADQQFGELDAGALADEVLREFNNVIDYESRVPYSLRYTELNRFKKAETTDDIL